jgi:hypothetical protein
MEPHNLACPATYFKQELLLTDLDFEQLDFQFEDWTPEEDTSSI